MLSSEDVEEWVAFHIMEREDENAAIEAAKQGKPNVAPAEESEFR